MGESNQVVIGTCPTCSAPAQFIGEGERLDEIRYVDLSAVVRERADALENFHASGKLLALAAAIEGASGSLRVNRERFGALAERQDRLRIHVSTNGDGDSYVLWLEDGSHAD